MALVKTFKIVALTMIAATGAHASSEFPFMPEGEDVPLIYAESVFEQYGCFGIAAGVGAVTLSDFLKDRGATPRDAVTAPTIETMGHFDAEATDAERERMRRMFKQCQYSAPADVKAEQALAQWKSEPRETDVELVGLVNRYTEEAPTCEAAVGRFVDHVSTNLPPSWSSDEVVQGMEFAQAPDLTLSAAEQEHQAKRAFVLPLFTMVTAFGDECRAKLAAVYAK